MQMPYWKTLLLAINRQRIVGFPRNLYEDAKSDSNDDRMSKISNFENSRWRTTVIRHLQNRYCRISVKYHALDVDEILYAEAD